MRERSDWRRTAAVVATFASLLTICTAAAAQDSTTADDGTAQQPTRLQAVKVQATADADTSSPGKPAALTRHTDKQTLTTLQIDSLADYARRLDAGVDFDSNNQSVNIRGLDENRVLTTIDDIRIPWLDDGARGVQGGVSTYDFDSLSAIDVVKSADSSFFGTGALGGVLALQTMNPEDLLGDDKTVGSLTKAIYNGSDDSWGLHQALAGRLGDTLLLVQAGYRRGNELDNKGDVGGTGSTRSKPNPSDYDQDNLLVKLNQYLAGGHRLGFTGELFTRDEDIDTLTSVGSTYSRYDTDEINKRQRAVLRYDYLAERDSGLVRQAHANLYVQRVTMQTNTDAYRTTLPIGTYDRDSDLEERSYGLNGYTELGFASGPLQHHLSLGGEAFLTRTTQYAAGEDNCTALIPTCLFLHVNQSDMPDVDGTTLGLYVQDRISDTDDRVRVTPGLRYDAYRQDPQETASYTDNAAYEGLPPDSKDHKFSPKLMLEWQAVPGGWLYAQWAQAFRAPSATELYLTYGGSGTYVSVGNPDLKPETSNGYELGFKYGDERRGAGISLYDNRYRNFIDSITTTAADAGLDGSYPYGVFQYVNRLHVEIYGIEAQARWTFDSGWHGWTSIVYAVGKDTDEDEHLNSIPPLKGIVGAGYQARTWGSDLSMTAADHRNKVEDDSSDLNKTPGYAIVDLTGWWQPEALGGLRLQAGVFNLFDRLYYKALDLPDSASQPKAYYSQPGRAFKASLQYQF
ncbi:TonB-dependent hemoglobin/transferrin/lactoferrin family receptor [Solimonas marina]|uniref:TonB-dependent hemoglobin/transferrin/lactoferrin family receptor n=1 Tax=Solimonas marina TaxID=2714601 RepID=A0A969WA80_9GAMM|nr:TonB-dependent hemoglobin/transferrin/lactoferrin family receptor [Solimonas marina]NKF22360.1 TonB-dependent hemoglobin/transferrin/lactoferrin family receptor [Solimonas marina]